MRSAIVVAMLAVVCGAATNDASCLLYSIPEDATKKERYIDRSGNFYNVEYYDPRIATNVVEDAVCIDPFTLKDGLVAMETFDASERSTNRLSLALWKDGELHGVQKSWSTNGCLLSEAPYCEGVRHGRFRHWNEKGLLVGDYTLTNGAGCEKVYHDTGFLEREIYYSNNLENGALFKFFPNGQAQSLGWCTNGLLVGDYISYGSTGDVNGVSYGDVEDKRRGIWIELDVNGAIIPGRVSFGVEGLKVTKGEFDASLTNCMYFGAPPIDLPSYVRTIKEKYSGLVREYKSRRVEIPLPSAP